MRLGQLARKLDTKTQEIVSYLEKQNVIIEDTSNTKIPEEHIESISEHFAPVVEEEVIAPPEPVAVEEEVVAEVAAEPTPDTDTAPIDESDHPDTKEVDSKEPTETPTEEVIPEVPAKIDLSKFEKKDPKQKQVITADIEVDDLPPTQDILTTGSIINEDGEVITLDQVEPEAIEVLKREDSGVIRKPQINLDGLKVVGKIDLPESKKQEDTVDEDGNPVERKLNPKELREAKRKEREEQRLKRELKAIERQKRDEERKKEQERRKQKQSEAAYKKKQYAEKLAKAKANEAAKPATKKKKKVAVQDESLPGTTAAVPTKKKQVKATPKPEPKTLLGRIWRWFNT